MWSYIIILLLGFLSLNLAHYVPSSIGSTYICEEEFDTPCLCDNPVADAALNIEDEVFFFQGEHYWVRNKHGRMSGARLTTNRWPAAPPDMDAALKLNTLNNATAFFKGNLMWVYTEENKLAKGYPKRIKEVLSNIPDDVSGTATFYWDDRLKDYFFKGTEYWFPGYGNAQSIKEWKLPEDTVITAGFKYHDYTYLFAGDKYWKYDPDINDVARTHHYPRSVAKYWFNCGADDQL